MSLVWLGCFSFHEPEEALVLSKDLVSALDLTVAISFGGKALVEGVCGMARTFLPPGFRFHPTDVELIMFYLKRKIMGKKLHFEAISELNIYKFSPWDLPDKSFLKSKDLEWYFFCPRERKYASGDRMKRGTETGFWKTTGKDRSIMYDERVVGMVKTLVFHEGNAPHGKRTDWLVYEYRMDDKNLADAGVPQDGYVLYKVFKKDGKGPKNGAQYGGPFKEEEWDNYDLGIATDSLPCDRLSCVGVTAPENQNSTALKSLIDPVCASALSVDEAGPSSVQTSSHNVLVDGLNNSMVTAMFDSQGPSGLAMNGQVQSLAGPSTNGIMHLPNDDLAAHLLAAIAHEQELGELGHCRENAASHHLDGNDPFNGLEDLGTCPELSGVNFSHDESYNLNNMLPEDDMLFLELNDLDTPLTFSVDSGGYVNVPTGSSFVACNPDASAHTLGSISSTQQSSGADLGPIVYNVNLPSSETGCPRLSSFSVCPDSSGRDIDSTNVFPTGNAYGDILSRGYGASYDRHSFSYRQPEESGDAAGNQERGMAQRNFFSRFQWLLESFSVHPASVAERLAPSNSAYGGSSIYVKAEVTHGFRACTKDALSVMLEESTYDYSCWWNLHGAEFWNKAADCSSSVVFYFGKCWILCGFWSVAPLFSIWLLFVEMLFLFQDDCLLYQSTKIPVYWNLFCEMLNRFHLLTNSFFSLMFILVPIGFFRELHLLNLL